MKYLSTLCALSMSLTTFCLGSTSADTVVEAENPEFVVKATALADKLSESAAQSVQITSIILQGDREVIADGVAESGVVLQLPIPGDRQAMIAQLTPFLGKTIDEEVLVNIKEQIFEHYRKSGYPFVIAKIPEQDVSQGRLRIKILEGHVAEIKYRGNRWFSDGSLDRFVHLKKGDLINQDQLLNDIASLNRNPFHYTEVTLAPGKRSGETDVEFNTKDRFPLRVYGGADNTGIDSTGRSRYYAGFNWGNAWGIGDNITYQWTTAASPRRFNSHYLGYTSFLPWYDTLTLYGTYAEIHPHIPHFTSEGRLIQGSIRYDMPFKPLYRSFYHQLEIGFDFKRTNSNLFFAEDVTIPLVTRNVNLTQLMLGYQLEDRFSGHELNFSVEVYGSPGKWLPDQTNGNFNSLRSHAKNAYIYGRINLGDIYQFASKFSVMGLVRAQGASGPLLPSEQFGLGGYNTVRGYNERDFDADNAVCVNLELRTPEIKLFSMRQKNHLSFLAFVDYGVGHNYHNEITGLGSTEYLLSAGVGTRFLIYPYLTARADYGFQLHHIPLSSHSVGRLHFSVTASY